MIFISYRIDDSNTLVTMLERELIGMFGKDHVFRDKTTIEGGDLWPREINRHLESCRVMLVVIGNAWGRVTFTSGKHMSSHRFHDAEDWVRKEISFALSTLSLEQPEKRKVIIPVLVDGTKMPDVDWLETFNLQELASCQAVELRTDHFEHDFNALVNLLRNKCPGLPFQDRLAQRNLQSSSENAAIIRRNRLIASFEIASAPLLAWPTTMPNGCWLERIELPTLLEDFRSNPSSSHIVTGPPGAGKSAILAKIAKQCRDDGMIVLGIKADFLPVTLTTVKELSNHVLGNLGDLVEEVVWLSESQAVAVIIDQMDALADLVDLTSGRLDLLLNLIQALRDLNNIHLVCSSRRYELHHDLRLNALTNDGDRPGFDVIELQPLSREQICTQLASEKLISEQWPARYFEFLSIPYHLHAFLKNVRTGTDQVSDIPENTLFESIHVIHEIHWKRTVGLKSHSSNRIGLLQRLAERISATEEFRQPISLFDEFETAVADLEQVGWIHSQGLSIGFSHQTQYEFVSARRFAGDPQTFIQHVLDREHGLFVRPIVWHTLNYSRSANLSGYLEIVDGLLRSVTRKHLRMLLIDFLGQIPDPQPNEVIWVTELLNAPATYTMMSHRLWRQKGWYNALSSHVLPALMGQPAECCWPVARILEYAWPFAADRNRELLRDYWSYREERAPLLWSVVTNSTLFDEELISWLCWIASNVDLTQWALCHTSQNVADLVPEFAPRILAAGLNRRLDAKLAVATSSPSGEPSDPQRLHEIALQTLRAEITSEVENRDWHGIDKIAEKAPNAFLQEVWPWFQRAIENCDVYSGSQLEMFRHERGYDHWFESELGPNYPLPWAIQIAVQGLARTDTLEFSDFIERNLNCNSMSVQHILTAGLTECASRLPNLAFKFLTTDRRRFFLGTFGNGMSAAMTLVHTASPHWTVAQIAAFQRSVLDWRPAGRSESKHDNEFRARLLASLPTSARLPESDAIVAKYQNSNVDLRRRQVSYTVKSPINAGEMQKISDANIVALFNRLVDATGTNDPEDWRIGGSEQTSHQFQEFAKLEPERAVAIIRLFHPTTQERPAGYALIGLADVNFNSAIICDLVRELNRKGFAKPEFRDDVGRALQDVAIADHGLPDDICSLLREWLLEDDLPQLIPESTANSNEDAERSASILWTHEGMISIPNRWYWIGVALKLGLCLAEPPRSEEWLEILSKCKERPFPKDVWTAWLFDFTNHFLPDRRDAAQIIGSVLSKRLDVFATSIGVSAFAHFSNWFDENMRHELLTRLCNSGWNRSQLAGAELVCLWALRDDDEKCRTLIETWLAVLSDDSEFETHCLGLANSAAHMWTEASWRAAAASILCKLVPVDSLRVRKSILNAFRQNGCLRADQATKDFLRSIAQDFNFESIGDQYFMSLRLAEFLPHESEAILRICQRTVTTAKRSANNREARYASSIPHFIAISLTLHRNSDTTIRKEALTLFEDLLELDAYGASEALTELDQRPIPTPKLSLE